MASWLQSYLAVNEDLQAFNVAARAEQATHFDLGSGIRRAVITGAAHNYRSAGGWQPLDARLRADGAGGLSAEGMAARLAPDGTVNFPAQSYAHRSPSVGVLRKGRYTPLAHFGEGRVAGDRFVRAAGGFQHVIRLTPSGIKEELIVSELPAEVTGQLVYETVLDAKLEPGREGEVAIKGLHLPQGWARDAAGNWLPVQRSLVEDGGIKLYTGVDLELLAHAAFPVVIDPTVSLTSASADGMVWGQNATYATARATSVSLDVTSGSMEVGQTLSGGQYSVWRGFLKFSLASIPSHVQIITATLGLAALADLSTLADFDVQIVKQDWSAQDPIAAGTREAAFDNCLAGVQDVVWRNTSGLSTGVLYQSPPLDVSWLTPGSNAYYSLRSSRDKNNTTPPGAGTERIQLAAAENATPALRPVLVLDYYTVASAIGKLAQPTANIAIYDTRIRYRSRKRRTLLSGEGRQG